jgi:hypothetical protein
MRTSTAMNASPAVTKQWELYNSFILDSGATTHICHTRDRQRKPYQLQGHQFKSTDTVMSISLYRAQKALVQSRSGTLHISQIAQPI